MRRSAVVLTALLMVLTLAAACSRTRSDAAIATDVKAAMFSEADLKSANLSVEVKDGEVTLAGEVPSDAARLQAFKIASQIPGVKTVNDQMTVQAAQVEEPAEPAPASEPARPARRRAPARTAPAPAVAPPPAPVASAAADPSASSRPPVPRVKHVEVPAGTTISVRLIDSINTEVNHAGEVFQASLDAPLVVGEEVVVPAGANTYLKLVDVQSAGRMTGRSEVRLELVRLDFQGKSYALVSSDYQQAGSSRGKRTAATIGGGAALGALIGAVAGGGKGAAIGAAVGAGGGTAVQAATKGKQIRLAPETRLDFQLEQPVEITYTPGKNHTRR